MNGAMTNGSDGAAADEYALTASGIGVAAAELEENYDAISNLEALQYWVNKRHLTSGNPRDSSHDEKDVPPWRLRSRLKTFSAALTLCLNLGVDPPDVMKTQPCAKLECWVDPTPLPSNKALEGIGRNLQQQFETLSPKVRYKQYLDPSVEETKKFALGLRKQAKDERVLMYYNGHGVPKPTASGEFWVFNKSEFWGLDSARSRNVADEPLLDYTQYIPVSLYDLQTWMGSPCIYVWDCSAAGNIVSNYERTATERDKKRGQAPPAEVPGQAPPEPEPSMPFSECIHLAACQADETLPMTPELPADLFTCCLTSPIEIALRFFVLQDPLRINADPNDNRSKITVDLVMKIPGDLKDRRTPLGELNWIFTAVTDTIAWLVFPRDVFKRLFRQDLLVAALFRNFLLAERIMRAYNCTPISQPALPATHNHPLWSSWDLAVDACLSQLPALLEAEAYAKEHPQAPPLYVYQPSRFFAEHLQAFEVWLSHGAPLSPRPPDQLPIVLQVLLSQAHRLRALILLSKFVDLGPWAVHLALSIGIFPYVQKLLQSPAVDLKPVLIFIWSRILAVDRSCQVDLLKDNGFQYFSKILLPSTTPLMIPNASEHRAMCAFILSMVCRGYKPGQAACAGVDVFKSCVARLSEEDWLLKQWSALCLAQMWADGNDEAKNEAVREGYQDQLIYMLKDEAAEVRAAVMYALGTFLGAAGVEGAKGGGGTGALLKMTERQQFVIEAGVAHTCVLQTQADASPLVRKELVVVLSCLAREWRGWFVAAAWCYYEPKADLVEQAIREWGDRPDVEPHEHEENIRFLTAFKLMFITLLELSVDPHPEVASSACTVVDYLVALLLDSSFPKANGTTLRPKKFDGRPRIVNKDFIPTTAPIPSPELSPPSPPPPPKQSETQVTRMTSTLKRNSSVANALKSLASITGFSTPEDEHPPPIKQEEPPKLSRTNTSNQLHVPNYVPPYPMSNHPSTDKVPRTPSLSSLLASSQRDFGPAPSFTAASVIAALAEEDMERLRLRRSQRTEAGGTSAGGMPQPHELGLGMIAKEVKDDVLPLRSEFYDYSTEYFKEPQMKVPDAEEPGSRKYNEQTWRQQRNLSMLEQVKIAEESGATSATYNRSLGTLQNSSWPSLLSFHAFEPHLAVTDESGNICIWDWQEKLKLSRLSTGSTISSVHFLNETAASLLLTASTDGSIRVYRDYIDGPQLASAFRGLTEKESVSRRAGVVTAWDQRAGHLFVGGDSRQIRIFDARLEALKAAVPTMAGAPATTLASDFSLYCSGFGDGVVRLFDARMEPDRAIVGVLREHTTWVSQVSMQRTGALVSGSADGQVKIWDLRKPTTSLSTTEVVSNGLSSMAIHDSMPLFAASSSPQATQGPSGEARRQQRVNVFRLPQLPDVDDSRDDDDDSDDSFSFKGENDDRDYSPKMLSSVAIRGDALPPTDKQPALPESVRPIPGLPSASSYIRRKTGVGFNSMAWHPNKFVLAVGGFDRSNGSVRLITYDPNTTQVEDKDEDVVRRYH